MVSQLHEVLVELFHRRPELAAELLSAADGVAVPPFEEARLQACELTDLAPTEYRADTVVVLSARAGPALAVVVEVQLTRDPGKRWSWPVYLPTLRARLRCPTVLLVLCADDKVADWCGTPIEVGHPGYALRPLVIGPHGIPLVDDPDRASRNPELAVLSAMAHGGEPDGEKVLSALLAGLRAVDDDLAKLYADQVLAALPAAAQAWWEDMMPIKIETYEYESDFARRYYGQGKTEGRSEGEAKALLRVLAARGIAVSDDARARITACTDLDQLERWLDRAVSVDSADELFAP